MLHRFRNILLLLATVGLLTMALASPVVAQRYDFPPRPDGPILDQGDLLSGGEERALARKLMAYEDTSSTAVVVVTLASLNGAPIDDYAISLGRDWGVGQEGKDNGVVVLVSKNDRKMFIATGYGVEGALPDAIANRIVERIMTPAFREGQFYAGLDRGTDAIIQATAGEYTAEQEVASSTDDGVSTTLIYIFLILAYFIGSSLWRQGRGEKKGAKKSRHRHGDLPIIIWGGGGGSRGGGGFGGGGGGFGGFGGGSFGGGGAGGSW